jgi:hypothetical protein
MMKTVRVMSAVANAIGGLAIFTRVAILRAIAMALLRCKKRPPEPVEKTPIYLWDGQL